MAGAVLGIARALDARPDDAALFPGWLPLAGATAAMLVAVALLARAWASVLDGDRHRLVGAFYASQLAKYLPGGIWQPAGLVLAAADDATARRQAATGFVVFAGVYAGVGAGLAGPVVAATATHLPGWARALTAAAALGLLATWRPAWDRLPGPVRRRLTVPTQPALTAAAVHAAAGLVAWGVAYAVLLGPLGTGASPLAAGAAAVLGWAAGFVAVPVPAGIGVREAVLVAVLPGDAGPVVAASLLHRAAGFAAELLLLGAHGIRTCGRFGA